MSGFDRYFHAPYRGVRAYVFAKVFLVMMALDTWMLMIGHAGRYGVDGFNVAHFGWLDWVAPRTSASLYVAVLLLTGLLALTIALGGAHRLGLALLFLLYTFSWSMSMLDSYQHHYFVSCVLLCLVFFPPLQAADVIEPDAISSTKQALRSDVIYLLVTSGALAAYAVFNVSAHPWLFFCACAGAIAVATFVRARSRDSGNAQLTTGFGYNLLGATVAVLYTFTSIAKMDTQWVAGHSIRRISSASKVFAPLVDLAAQLGIPNESFWSLLSTSVIPVELTIAVGYLLAPLQDAKTSRPLRWLTIATAWFALSLHVGAEAMGLEIGWFSYYMLLLACCFLLPGRAVQTLALLVTRPAHWLTSQLNELGSDSASRRTLETLLTAAAVGVVLTTIGYLLDLPGAAAATIVAAVTLIAITLHGVSRGNARWVRRLALTTGCAGALMWAAIASSEVRWDFYRYLGGDLSRRGLRTEALDAYVKGERYAPRGQTRRDKIDELRRQLSGQ
jgi:hypothetical protein